VCKPNRKIFQKAMDKAAECISTTINFIDIKFKLRPEDFLIIGDNYEKDIVGGMEAGMGTCWISTSSLTRRLEEIPSDQISEEVDSEKQLSSKRYLKYSDVVTFLQEKFLSSESESRNI